MDGTCRIEGCGRPIAVVGDQLCQGHYKQKRDGQPFREILARGKRLAEGAEACAYPPCERPKRSKGYCNTHYLQSYHGRPLSMTKPRVATLARDAHGNKWCSCCESWRETDRFASSKGSADGLQSRCRDCNAAIYRGRSEVVRDQMREARFGLTRVGFDALLEEQGGRCAICLTDDPGTRWWCVDHDHACCPEDGRSCGSCVRGILCHSCNAGIGHLRDSPTALRRAADYLEQSARRPVRDVA